jgi:hypothetical protein
MLLVEMPSPGVWDGNPQKSKAIWLSDNRSNRSRSRRRAANGSKRMYLDYTHGLFIT